MASVTATSAIIVAYGYFPVMMSARKPPSMSCRRDSQDENASTENERPKSPDVCSPCRNRCFVQEKLLRDISESSLDADGCGESGRLAFDQPGNAVVAEE